MSAPTRRRRPRLLEAVAQPDAHGLKLLRDAAETMRLSARGYHRVLRVARTLADLDGADTIGPAASGRSVCRIAHWLRISGAPPRACLVLIARLRRVNPPVTSFVYALPTISPALCGPGQASACHVAFQDFGFGRSLADSRSVRARRVPARPAALHRGRGSLGPDHLRALACRPPRRLHRRSGGGHRAGPDLGECRGGPIFAIVDDVDSQTDGQRDNACEATLAPQLVAISATPSGSEPRDLSDPGRSRRLPDFRAIEEFYAARSRRLDRWRQRRALSFRRRLALNLILTLYQPCSHRTVQRRPASSTLQGRHRIVVADT